jgi:hypothetical protein
VGFFTFPAELHGEASRKPAEPPHVGSYTPHTLRFDLKTRGVRHVSGAVVVFREYANEDDWFDAGVSAASLIENGFAFRGPQAELVRVAREVALHAGMRNVAD